MRRWLRVFWKIVKWILISVVSILLLTLILINLPPVHDYLLKKGTAFFNEKTGGNLQVEEIDLRLPYYIQLQDVSLQNPEGNLLASINNLEVSLGWRYLFNRTIRVDKIELEDAEINLYHSEAGWNYDFIVEGFTDSTAAEPSTDTTGTAWDISLGNLRLSDVGFNYLDQITGDSIDVELGEFALAMDRLSLEEQVYLAESIKLTNTNAFIRYSSEEPDSVSQSETSSAAGTADQESDLTLGVESILLENNSFLYKTGSSSEKYFIDLGHLALEVNKINLSENLFDLSSFELTHSNFELTLMPSEEDTSSAPVDPFAPINLTLSQLTINEVDFSMATANSEVRPLEIENLQSKIYDISADSTAYKADLESLNLVYNGLDRLEKLEADIILSREKLALENLHMVYGNTSLVGGFIIDYESFSQAIAESKFEYASLNIEELRVNPADLEQIVRVLDIEDASQYIPEKEVSIQADISGQYTDLEINNASIRTGRSSIELDAQTIGDLWSERDYKINNLSLDLYREDLLSYTGRFGLDSSLVPPNTSLDLDGTFSSTNSNLNAMLRTSYGNIDIQAKGGGWKNEELPLDMELNSERIEVGKFLGLQVPLVLDFQVFAQTENAKDSVLNANFNLITDTLIYDDLKISNLDLTGNLEDNKFAYDLAVRDSFLVMTLSGQGQLEPNLTTVLEADINGVNLQAIGLVKDDIRGRIALNAAYEQDSLYQYASIDIGQAIFVKDEQRYELAPISGQVYLGADSTMAKVSSPFLELYSVTNRSIEGLIYAMGNMGEDDTTDDEAYWRANFESTDMAELRALFLPELSGFEPSSATVLYEGSQGRIDANVKFPGLRYGDIVLDSLRVNALGRADQLSVDMYVGKISLDTLGIENISLKTRTREEGSELELLIKNDSITDYYAQMILDVDSSITAGYDLHFTDSLILNRKLWRVDSQNEIRYNKEGIALEKLRIYRNNSELEITKTEEQNTTNIKATAFNLGALAGIIATEKLLLSGSLYGDFMLNADGSFAGDGRIEKLNIAEADFGLFTWQAEKTQDGFIVDIGSTGEAIEFKALGKMKPTDDTGSALDLDFDLKKLEVASLSKLLPSLFYNGTGKITGGIEINGTTSAPKLSGGITFSKATLALQANGASYNLQNETIDIEPEKISFDNFTMLDSAGNKLQINGNVSHNNFDNIKSDLTVRARNFELADIKPGKNEMVYGKLFGDLDIEITGRADAPKIDADVRISDKTNMVYTVPEDEYVASFDDGLIEWTDFESEDFDILNRNEVPKRTEAVDVYANTIDLTGSIAIDKRAQFRVVIDSAAGDYLQIQGGGNLGITYDRVGNFRLNGTYEVTDGFYQMTFYNIVKKKFYFQSGSTISWSGDPLDANMDITALYKTRTGIQGLMVSDASAASSEAFRQQLPFEVVMNLTGELSEPEVSFGIQLAPESRGALGGAVEARLNQLEDDENELNKQVFALLVLNSFLNSGTGGSGNIVSAQARSSASQILSQQLNALSDKFIAGVDLNFDLNSYGGAAGQGNTDLNVDLAKSFLDDRVIVRVGSTIQLENSDPAAAQGSDQIMTNFTVEYKITPDGRYRFQVYSKTDFEDIVVGRITRTGAGVIFQRDFNRIKNIFSPVETKEEENIPLEEDEEENTE